MQTSIWRGPPCGMEARACALSDAGVAGVDRPRASEHYRFAVVEKENAASTWVPTRREGEGLTKLTPGPLSNGRMLAHDFAKGN